MSSGCRFRSHREVGRRIGKIMSGDIEMKTITAIGILAGIGGFVCAFSTAPAIAAVAGSLAVCNSILLFGQMVR